MRYKIELSSNELPELTPHIRGPEYLSCLRDIANDLREKSKYATLETTTWGEVYDLLWKHLSESNIDPFNE
jgi:hypothetical protein